jgi:predicted membrane protein
MKKIYFVDLIFIIILALVLTVVYETGLPIKMEFLFIPFLICYYIGRYATYFINKAK